MHLSPRKLSHQRFVVVSSAHCLLRSKLYKLQFKKWDWQKNLPATHSRFMVEKAHKRKLEEKKDTIFEFGGQQWDHDKYARLVRGSKAQGLEQAQGKKTLCKSNYHHPNLWSPGLPSSLRLCYARGRELQDSQLQCAYASPGPHKQ